MSAIPEDFIKKTAKLSDDVTRPFPASKKIYVEGSRPDIQVPMREVECTPTHTEQGDELNPPIYIYDTSGPYTDPQVKIDLLKSDGSKSGASTLRTLSGGLTGSPSTTGEGGKARGSFCRSRSPRTGGPARSSLRCW